MGKVLMRRIEVWRCDTEVEADDIIAEAAVEGELTKKTIEHKQRKSKGQVIDENKRVTVQIDFAGQWPDDEDM